MLGRYAGEGGSKLPVRYAAGPLVRSLALQAGEEGVKRYLRAPR